MEETDWAPVYARSSLPAECILLMSTAPYPPLGWNNIASLETGIDLDDVAVCGVAEKSNSYDGEKVASEVAIRGFRVECDSGEGGPADAMDDPEDPLL